jgi:CRP-like cAMP-binding protein/precorrin-6B methylase 2
MAIRVVQARDERDRWAVARFLYDLWGDEPEVALAGLDHERRVLRDEADAHAEHLVALDDAGDIAGALRLNFLDRGPLPADLTEWLGLGELCQAFPSHQVATTTHLAVARDQRGHTVASRLMAAGVQRLLQEGVLVDVGCCGLDEVPLHAQLGSRPFLSAFRQPGLGACQPIALLPRDRRHLAAVQSPFAGLVPAELDDGGATACRLKEIFGDFRALAFDRLPARALWARLARSGPELPRDEIGLFDGFEHDDLALMAPHVVRQVFAAGQVIYRRGDREPGMGMVLSGNLGVVVPAPGGRVVAVLGPAQPFGELQALVDGRRTADLVALERSEVILLPGDLLERVARHRPDLGARLAARLLTIVGRRLAATTGELIATERARTRPARPHRPALYAHAPDLSELSGRAAYALPGDEPEAAARRAWEATAVTSLEIPALRAAGLGDGHVVLDLCTGEGVFACCLAQRFPGVRVIAVQPDAGSRARAESLAARLGVAGRVQVLDATVRALPLEDASVDLAYARFGLKNGADAAAVLAELARVTRPGGVVCALARDDRGVILHPPVPGWEDLARAEEVAVAAAGGDPRIGRHMRALMGAARLEQVLVEVLPASPEALGHEAFVALAAGGVRPRLEAAGRWEPAFAATLDEVARRAADPDAFCSFSLLLAVGGVSGGLGVCPAHSAPAIPGGPAGP